MLSVSATGRNQIATRGVLPVMRLRSTLLGAVLAGSLAMAGCGGQPSDRSAADGASGSDPAASSDPTATTTEPGTEIPDDFPLAVGMGGPDDVIATSRTGTGLRDLTLCDTAPLRGLGTRDRLIADNSGGESANTRELVLLGNPDEARQVAEAFADLPSACQSPTVTGDMETRTEVRESPFGPAPATTLLQTYTFDGKPGDGATVIHVVPVGAALLVTSTYGQWTDATLEDGVAETVDAVRQTVGALAQFDDGSTPSSEPGPEPSESATTSADVPAIPDDFPLAVGLPEDDGEIEVSPPATAGDGMGEVEMCGAVVWPIGGTAGGTRRLVDRRPRSRVVRRSRAGRTRRRGGGPQRDGRGPAGRRGLSQLGPPGVDRARAGHRLRHGDDGPDLRQRPGQLGLPGDAGRFRAADGEHLR